MITASYGFHSKPAYSLAGICQALWQLFQPSIQFKYPTWSFVIGYLVTHVLCKSIVQALMASLAMFPTAFN